MGRRGGDHVGRPHPLLPQHAQGHAGLAVRFPSPPPRPVPSLPSFGVGCPLAPPTPFPMLRSFMHTWVVRSKVKSPAGYLGLLAKLRPGDLAPEVNTMACPHPPPSLAHAASPIFVALPSSRPSQSSLPGRPWASPRTVLPLPLASHARSRQATRHPIHPPAHWQTIPMAQRRIIFFGRTTLPSVPTSKPRKPSRPAT